MDVTKLGQLIKTRRGALGLTQGALAQMVFGDSARKGDISRLEKARIKNPHQATLHKLFEALELDVSILVSDRVFDTYLETVTQPTPQHDTGQVDSEAVHMMLELARRVSPHVRDVHDAHVALDNCVEMARDVMAEKQLYNSQSERQNHVRQQVARLAADGEGQEALRVITNELNYVRDTRERLKHHQIELLELAEAQALAIQHWDKASDYAVELWPMRLDDPKERAERILEAWQDDFDPRFTHKDSGLILYWNTILTSPMAATLPELDIPRAQVALEYAQDTGKSEDYLATVHAYDRAIAHIPAEDQETTGTALHNRAMALRHVGTLQGDSALLRQAIHGFEAALSCRPQNSRPTAWASTQNALGLTWQALGERSQERTDLEHAITAYLAALEVRTADESPLEWAATQNNLGTAYRLLSELTEEEEHAAAAAAAFRATLNARSLDHTPQEWATTQNNLGGALATLGELRQDLKLLDEAVAAFRGALDVFTRKSAPFDWARTRINVAIALRSKYLFEERAEDRLMALQALSGVEAELIERDAKSLLRLYYQVAGQISQL